MENNRVTIIAEAGVNHNGDISLARELIDVAAEAGADYVKFQAFTAEKLVSREAPKAEYQRRNVRGKDDRQFAMLKRLEMDADAHKQLLEYCKEKGIGFMSSPFDEEGADMLEELGIEIFKIPSGEITNLPYLRHIARKQKKVIMSTGMADLKEVGEALDVLKGSGLSLHDITVLHCNTDYPTKMEDVNLLAMQTIGKEFGVETGYSDHTPGIEIPTAAAALGASVIEKHFTLDRNMEGPDHRASLEPEELERMVSAIRNVERALGSGNKQPSESEAKNRSIARKSIHLNRDLNKGDILQTADLVMLRPGDGISPMLVERLIGEKLKKDLPKGHKITFTDLHNKGNR